MKKLLCGLVLTSSMLANAEVKTPEWFSMPNEGEIRVDAGYIFTTSKYEFDQLDTEVESSSNVFGVTTQYGINKNVAVSLNLGQRSSDGHDGMDDPELSVKLHYGKFVGSISYTMAQGEYEDGESHTQGGDSIDLTAGFIFNDNFSLYAYYAPSYDYEVKDSSSDYESGSSMTFMGYYQRQLNEKNLFFVGVGQAISNPGSVDGEDTSDDSSVFLVSQAGFNYKINDTVEIIPVVGYFHYLGENDDISGHVTMSSIRARLRF